MLHKLIHAISDCFTSSSIDQRRDEAGLFPAYHDQLLQLWSNQDQHLTRFMVDLDLMVMLSGQKACPPWTFHQPHQSQNATRFTPVRLFNKRDLDEIDGLTILRTHCHPMYYNYIGSRINDLACLMGAQTVTLSHRGVIYFHDVPAIFEHMQRSVQNPRLKDQLAHDAAAISDAIAQSYTCWGAQITPSENRKFWKLKSWLMSLLELIDVQFSQEALDERDASICDVLLTAGCELNAVIDDIGSDHGVLQWLSQPAEFMDEFIAVLNTCGHYEASVNFASYQVTSAADNSPYWVGVSNMPNRLYSNLFKLAIHLACDMALHGGEFDRNYLRQMVQESVTARLALRQKHNN